jgi:hypothetical protein
VGYVFFMSGLSWSSDAENSKSNASPKPLRAAVRVMELSSDKSIAEIVLKDKSIITVEAWVGGQSPRVRAEKVVARLNEALELGATFRTFKVEAPHFEEAIVAFGRPIITSTYEDQWATGLSRAEIMKRWYASLISALSQSEPQSHGDIVLVDEDPDSGTFSLPITPLREISISNGTDAPSKGSPDPRAAGNSKKSSAKEKKK